MSIWRAGMGVLWVAVSLPALAADVASQPASTQPAQSWIWSQAGADKDAPNQTIFYRYEFQLPGPADQADLSIVADNTFELYVNGSPVADGQDWVHPVRMDAAASLKPGKNILAVKASSS